MSGDERVPPGDARIWVRPHYPTLNGLRGLAILAVFCRHYVALVWPNFVTESMWVGVDLFFVLSGFLITGILFDTVHGPRYFRNFYVRRALRVFPAYYAVLTALVLLKPTMGAQFSWTVFLNYLYLGNLAAPLSRVLGGNATVITLRWGGQELYTTLGPFWSLCVEEHFYLLWPLVVWRVRQRERLMRVCVWGAAGVMVLRCVTYAVMSRGVLGAGLLYSVSVFRFDSLLVGSWLALWLRGRALSAAGLRVRAAGVMMGAGAACGVGTLLTIGRWPQPFLNPFLGTVGYSVIAVGMAGLLLLSLEEGTAWARGLQMRWLAGLGVVSYGFYLVHELPEPALLQLQQTTLARHGVGWLVVPLGLAAGLVPAVLSFRYFERPILRLKERFAPQETFAGARLHVAEPK